MRRLQPDQLTFARELRANATDAERLLWSRLRGQQLGRRFRRQHPIGPCFADFACIEARLVIEVDGGQHNASAADVARDEAMKQLGWRVVRFWNNEVMGNMQGVLEVVAAALAGVPPPQPSPLQGEGAKT